MAHLFLDGSSSITLVGLTNGPYRTLPGRAPSDGLLFQAIREVLTEAQIVFGGLSSVAAGCGPGSHTGTRAMAAIAKGLAMGLAKPFKLFPSLLLQLPQKEGLIGTSLTTRQDLLYMLAYNTKSAQVEFSGLLSPVELETYKADLDHFGHEYSIFHLARFLDTTPPASLNQPLHYLNFS